MLNGSSSALTHFFTKEKVIILVLVGVLLYAMYVYSGSKFVMFDGMEDGSVEPAKDKPAAAQVPAQAPVTAPSTNALKPVSNPADLLPTDSNSSWGSLSPVQGGTLMPDLLQAGYHAGLNTIGQSLKNANLQLRSDPIIPRQDIGPWNQSTIEDPPIRREFEIGN